MNTSKLTRLALLGALALIFGYIESLFPLPVSIPGIKLGLSNIVVLFVLIRLGAVESFFIMLIKVLLPALLWSGASGLLYSAAGGFLSWLFMTTFKKHFSTVGISTLGGITHNAGQILAAALILGTGSVIYYLPFLIISGIIVGTLTGITCRIAMDRLEKSGFC